MFYVEMDDTSLESLISASPVLVTLQYCANCHRFKHPRIESRSLTGLILAFASDFPLQSLQVVTPQLKKLSVSAESISTSIRAPQLKQLIIRGNIAQPGKFEQLDKWQLDVLTISRIKSEEHIAPIIRACGTTRAIVLDLSLLSWFDSTTLFEALNVEELEIIDGVFGAWFGVKELTLPQYSKLKKLVFHITAATRSGWLGVIITFVTNSPNLESLDIYLQDKQEHTVEIVSVLLSLRLRFPSLKMVVRKLEKSIRC
jgi:hypothetical protein